MPLPSPRLSECTFARSAQTAPLSMLLTSHTASLSGPVAATCLNVFSQLQVSCAGSRLKAEQDSHFQGLLKPP